MTDREIEGPPARRSGELLAPGYRVIQHMRRGEDLDVYDVWSDERDCRCIGKTLRPDRLDNAKARARLLREGRLLLRLTHPHIVRAYEVQTNPGPLVIEETLPGETLAHLIDRQPRWLRVQDVAQLGIHLCSAIGYLHRAGWLHLDIKPSNIVSSNGMAKVLDLSLARAPGSYRGGSGTPGYMAPEQIEGGKLGPFTDVWGIGATLYEAATGEAACDAGADESAGDERSSATHDISQEVCLPAPVRRARRLPKTISNAIDRSIGRNPADRPTIAELAAMLELALPTNARSRPTHRQK